VGCHYAGLVYTCASSRLTSHELEYIINDCGARAFITSKYKADQAAEIIDSTPHVELRLMLDGTVDGYESYETAVAEQSPEPLDEARVAGLDMLYSSGTTGMPKGITRAFPNEPLDSSASAVQGLLQFLFGMDGTKRYLSPAPFYHAAPLRFCLAVPMPSAPQSWRWNTSTPRSTCNWWSGTTSPTARSCRPCSCGCSSFPRRRARPTTSRRSSA
jgi:long-chain acyl-CoA synthetase